MRRLEWVRNLSERSVEPKALQVLRVPPGQLELIAELGDQQFRLPMVQRRESGVAADSPILRKPQERPGWIVQRQARASAV